jgi:hypothetical protein
LYTEIACSDAVEAISSERPKGLRSAPVANCQHNSGRVVGYPEVILGLDLFGGQVVNALFSCVGSSTLTQEHRLIVALRIN